VNDKKKPFYTQEVGNVPIYQWVAWLVSVVLIAVFAYLGIDLPDLPPPPAAVEAEADLELDLEDLGISTRGTTNLDTLELSGDLTVTDDLTVGDTLTVQGDVDYDGDGFDLNTTGAISFDADAASNFNVAGAGIDLTLESEAGRLILKGDEAAANGVTIDANDAVTTGLDIDVGSVSGVTIDGGMVDIGGGTCGVADGDNDVCIAAVLEVDGELELDGALDADSTADIADTLTLSKGSGNGLVVTSNIDANGAIDVDGTANLDEVDVDGVLNLVVGTEHIGVMSIVSTAITYTAAAGGTGAVVTVADGEIWIVHAVLVNVTENFDATGDDATLVIGDGNDADGFVVLADAELQTTDTEGTGFQAGWQGLVPATQGVYVDAAAGSNYFIYAPSGAAETIDWLVDETDGETLSAGAATIYVIYTRIQ